MRSGAAAPRLATLSAMPRRNYRKGEVQRPGRNRSSRARHELDGWRKAPAFEAPAARTPAPVICPRGKRGYPEHVARAKLDEYAKSDRPNRPVRVYRCPHCDAWHLTSSPLIEHKAIDPAERARQLTSKPPVPPPGRARRPERS